MTNSVVMEDTIRAEGYVMMSRVLTCVVCDRSGVVSGARRMGHGPGPEPIWPVLALDFGGTVQV